MLVKDRDEPQDQVFTVEKDRPHPFIASEINLFNRGPNKGYCYKVILILVKFRDPYNI